MFGDLRFWSLIAALIAFAAKLFNPSFPYDQTQVLLALLVFLALGGLYPKLRYAVTVGWSDLLHSLEFWTLIAALISFVLHYYVPTFPFDQVAILGLILFILHLLGIEPSVISRVARFAVRAAEQKGHMIADFDKKAYAMQIAKACLPGANPLLLEAAIEAEVYNEFNDPVVHKYLEM